MTSAPSTMPRRVAVIAVCVASAAVCWALAWWQWERFSSTGGSFQNLGYVLQWPLFGLFPAFVFWRMRRLRKQAELACSAEADQSAVEEQSRSTESVVVPASAQLPASAPASAKGDTPDDELAAYNRYLAELNARDQ